MTQVKIYGLRSSLAVRKETPRANWGIRGQPGDELALSYKVDV